MAKNGEHRDARFLSTDGITYPDGMGRVTYDSVLGKELNPEDR